MWVSFCQWLAIESGYPQADDAFVPLAFAKYLRSSYPRTKISKTDRETQLKIFSLSFGWLFIAPHKHCSIATIK
ncbi:hypothetical protein [Chamaesiphon sp. VAR_48_metabat_135_sub]|uniref:hypothetical protein n=1 Tax=Chamaesiphon sp. VAR_48_metabat_135_sub TaxID=2964699 RepID=UPI00286B3D49|nr:hypothetical protein [Chamaesiphon sp. VAR_48_metabat_135_sub]